MAQNKWVTKKNYGYVGTDSADIIFLTEYLNISEEEVEALSDEEAASKVNELLWEEACEQVEVYSRPAKEGEDDWRHISSNDD